jgi:4-amino-4-deoxy-L-arabinose transferase-like glycosyltransferase
VARTAVVGVLVFVLAFAVRALWIGTLGHTLVWDDERDFAAIAAALVRGDGYVGDSYRANPVMPVYLAAVFRVFGERYEVARLGQALLGAGTCVLLFRIGSLVAPEVGVLAGLLLAFYPAHVYLAGVFYVDCVQTFLCTWLLYVVLRGAESRRPFVLGLGAGLLLGLAMLARPIVGAYLPCLCGVWLLADRRPWRARIVVCAACVLGVAFALSPWLVRNERAYGRLLPVSSGFATKLWQGNNELARGGPDDRDMMVGTPDWYARLEREPEPARRALAAKYAPVADAIDRRARELGDVGLARDDVLGPIALGLFVDDPGRVLRLAARKLTTLFSAFSATETENENTTTAFRMVAALTFYPLLALAIAGAWLGRAQARRLLAMYVLVGSLAGAYALLTACTRFRLPLDPYLIVLAAIALADVRRRWRHAA